jgi:transposase
MAIAGAPPLTPAERAVLEHDYRRHPDPLVRRRCHIVLLAAELATQGEIARAVRCSTDTVRRALDLFRAGGRSALGRLPVSLTHTHKRTLAWQKELAQALERGPEACGVSRPTWTAVLLIAPLLATTGILTGERTVRRGLESLGFVCRRPTWTVRHKAEEQPEYQGKRKGSSPC